ncbi:T-box transcription factor TBX3-like isoform X2 [Cimex lectularius]|nr:T-box transcription factor TBX3-like isoform X2 [Cimex lectularius]
MEREVFHPEMNNVQVELKNVDLWKQFHKEGTEMIITKSGRRMFPSLRLSLKGLHPDVRYFVLFELTLSSNHRFKFISSEWVTGGGAEPQTHASTRMHIHPDSPATGASWMAQDVSFHRVKLTNNTLDRSGNLVLTSMHKYQPRIHIVKASDILALTWSPTLTVTFPETEFIAVTAYQNQKITKLKIDYNPFAKGFRENGQARTKRKAENLSLQSKRDCNEVQEVEDLKQTGDDSGVSVTSDSPGPSVHSPSPPVPLISDIPPPPFYPHSLWPYPIHFPPTYPFVFPSIAPFYHNPAPFTHN